MQVASNEQKDKHKESQFQVPIHSKMLFCMFVWTIKTSVAVLENCRAKVTFSLSSSQIPGLTCSCL